MKIKNLIPHISTGDTDDSFVGMKIIGNSIHFYFPESYHFDPDNLERDDFLDLLKTISIAKKSSVDVSGTYDSRQEGSDFGILSYIWIVEDYLKNGFYKNFNKIFKENQKGRINWKRTLQRQPIISEGKVIYPELVAEIRSPRETILIEAHKYCVKKSISLIGWLYGLTPDIVEVAANAEKTVVRYLDAIKSELDRTFDDEKHSRLIHMENVLLGLDESVDDKDIVYGVDTYHYIFERMVDRIFGTERVEDYYPKFTWHLKYSDSPEGMSGPTIRPDTILKYGADEDIYIIDSKFYRYGSINLSQTKGLPEAASIVKQITYGSYVQSEHPNNRVYNVFVLPYDSKSPIADVIKEQEKKLVYIGNVASGWECDKTYGKVHAFLVDLRHVVRIWNRLIHEDEKKILVNSIKENA